MRTLATAALVDVFSTVSAYCTKSPIAATVVVVRLLHEQLRRGRIERNVDRDSRRRVRRERRAERAGAQAIRAARRLAEFGDAQRRRKCMAGRRVDFER